MYLIRLSALAIALGCTVTGAGAADLTPPSPQTLAMEARASGVQIYSCAARKDDSSKYEWSFVAPEADLFGLDGNRIGKHYAGPTWEGNDGSKVTGALKVRDEGPDTKSIPWLLLAASGNSGKGMFSQTMSIQRIKTQGGKAPEVGCDKPHAGDTVKVPYTATYLFFK